MDRALKKKGLRLKSRSVGHRAMEWPLLQRSEEKWCHAADTLQLFSGHSVSCNPSCRMFNHLSFDNRELRFGCGSCSNK